MLRLKYFPSKNILMMSYIPSDRRSVCFSRINYEKLLHVPLSEIVFPKQLSYLRVIIEFSPSFRFMIERKSVALMRSRMRKILIIFFGWSMLNEKKKPAKYCLQNCRLSIGKRIVNRRFFITLTELLSVISIDVFEITFCRMLDLHLEL